MASFSCGGTRRFRSSSTRDPELSITSPAQAKAIDCWGAALAARSEILWCRVIDLHGQYLASFAACRGCCVSSWLICHLCVVLRRWVDRNYHRHARQVVEETASSTTLRRIRIRLFTWLSRIRRSQPQLKNMPDHLFSFIEVTIARPTDLPICRENCLARK